MPDPMPTLLEQLLDVPHVRLVIERLESELEAEADARAAFYDWVSEDQKAEFINGEIIVHSPDASKHIRISGFIVRLLATYADVHGVGEVMFEKAMIRLTRNDYEPDVCFFRKAVSDTFTPDQRLFPAPDLVVEILSQSTARRDTGIKFRDYAAHGIKEYWIVDPDKQHLRQYVLPSHDEDEYKSVGTFSGGDVPTSRVLPEFSVSVAAFFDRTANVEALRRVMD